MTLPFPLPLYFQANLRVQSRNTTWGTSQPCFGCLTNRIAQEQHFTRIKNKRRRKKGSSFPRKRKTASTAAMPATNLWTESALATSEVVRSSCHSTSGFVYIVYIFCCWQQNIHVKKKAYQWCYPTGQVPLYSVMICGQWRQRKASLHCRRQKKILFCMITVDNIVM